MCMLTVMLSAQAREPITNYRLGCMGCHLADGSGAPGKVPSMRDSLVTLAAMAEGRRYLVQVPGMAQSPFTDAEVAQLLNWMIRNLSDQSVPAHFVEFTEAEVAEHRDGWIENVASRRAMLLSKATAPPTQRHSADPGQAEKSR